ncbi:dual adapter for phosphotyrosine and 3-phosphotyrosine and 3-phosphoinositide-like [Mya arenaria]|uniref:dual adapter for phosphotyrosine and 3-phosphotyrosine and 3-phosphoinositide-like n=1 Tax=Mya arenaria TaxID=6604 RepID=UPI0022E8268C|nr:dual adapter for phosphotyrosine and 3-phosphotyrosine and 3-phosphoinositide-like [Mya arenaria]
MANDPYEVRLLKEIEFFHTDLNRHKAECMLLQNGQQGSFLIRNSSKPNPNEFAVSVRTDDAVKNFELFWSEDGFQFGHGTYLTCEDLTRHFSSKPLLAGDSGKSILLEHPYPRDVLEPQIYDAVCVHAEGGNVVEDKHMRNNYSINSKDGYLTKLGAIFKTWKVRYWKLQSNELKYFKDTSGRHPIRTLDLDECKDCKFLGKFRGKEHVFSLEFGWRTFYLFGKNDDESQDWVERIKWRLDNMNKG